MKNKTIYSRTFRFALLRMLVGLAGIAVGAIITALGYFITRGMGEDVNVITTGICLIVGVVVFGLIVHYLGYMLKAGQIAMITQAVTEGTLPDDVVAAGKEAVKARFATANVYFALSSAIRGITSQITQGVNTLSSLAGGDKDSVVGTIGSLISLFISIVLEYVNYCCLGWVFHNPNQSAFKSTCDGAVLYFQNWKTLLKSAGKVMAITLICCILLFAAFGFLSITLMEALLPDDAAMETTVLTTDEGDSFTVRDLAVIASLLLAMLAAGLVHTAFIKPYLLVMVMRGYMDAAQGSGISFDLYEKLCGLSSRFKKLFTKAREEQPQEFQTI